MKKVELIAGDFEQRKWELDVDKLKTGKYIVRQIPIRDIVSLDKEEEVGRTVYVEAVLGTGQKFKAVMSRGTYKTLYASFTRFGNKPVNNQLPLRKKSITEFFFAIVALFFVILILFSSDNDKNEPAANEGIKNESVAEEMPANTVNSHAFFEKDKVALCKAYIAELFQKPVSIIKHARTDDNGLIYVSYIRKADNTLWEQVCKVEQEYMLWSAWLKDTQEWGRWRNEDRVALHYDDQSNAVTFKLSGQENSVSVPLAH